ncbi:MAG: hypothetical protein AAF242_05695, partial [Bacteroidota bacterium]
MFRISWSKYFLIGLVMGWGFFACERETIEDQVDPYAGITDTVAREIARASIEHAGGMERWQNMQSLKYTKQFSLLLASGEVEKSFDQVHDYQMSPTVIDVISVENGLSLHTRLEDGVYSRTEDDVPLDIPQETLRKAINTSTYVIGMPFKLLDPGVVLKYEGETTMQDGRVVDILSASYNADENANHSTTDVWKYYFDKEDRKIVA